MYRNGCPSAIRMSEVRVTSLHLFANKTKLFYYADEFFGTNRLAHIVHSTVMTLVTEGACSRGTASPCSARDSSVRRTASRAFASASSSVSAFRHTPRKCGNCHGKSTLFRRRQDYTVCAWLRLHMITIACKGRHNNDPISSTLFSSQQSVFRCFKDQVLFFGMSHILFKARIRRGSILSFATSSARIWSVFNPLSFRASDASRVGSLLPILPFAAASN